MARELSFGDLDAAEFTNALQTIIKAHGIPQAENLLTGANSANGKPILCVRASPECSVEQLTATSVSSGLVLGLIWGSAAKHKVQTTLVHYETGDLQGLQFPNTEGLILSLNSLLPRQEDKIVLPDWYEAIGRSK